MFYVPSNPILQTHPYHHLFLPNSQNRFMCQPILISVEIRSYDSLSINKSKAAILAINRYIKGLLVVRAKGGANSTIRDLRDLRESFARLCLASQHQVLKGHQVFKGHQSLLEKEFSFPTKRKMFTVLRSPHIDKKSREHFQWKQSKITLFLEFKKPGEWDLFLFILENARLPGVQLLVGCQYSTFCAF